MNCPRCKTVVLKPVKYQALPVGACPGCLGLWLDPDEFAYVLDHHDKSYTPELVRSTLRKAQPGIPNAERKARLQCPACSQPLHAVNWSYSSGVIINVCSKDGIWFDKGELEQIEAFYDEWEAKKVDIKEEYRAALTQIEREHWASYERMRAEVRDKVYFHHGVGWWLDRLQQDYELSHLKGEKQE